MNAPPVVEHADSTPNDQATHPVTGNLDRRTPAPGGAAVPDRSPREDHAQPHRPFCACGHDLRAHLDDGRGRCGARLPDTCACRGAREGARSIAARQALDTAPATIARAA